MIYSVVDQLRFIGYDANDVLEIVRKEHKEMEVRLLEWGSVITLESNKNRLNIYADKNGKFLRISNG